MGMLNIISAKTRESFLTCRRTGGGLLDDALLAGEGHFEKTRRPEDWVSGDPDPKGLRDDGSGKGTTISKAGRQNDRASRNVGEAKKALPKMVSHRFPKG